MGESSESLLWGAMTVWVHMGVMYNNLSWASGGSMGSG